MRSYESPAVRRRFRIEYGDPIAGSVVDKINTAVVKTTGQEAAGLFDEAGGGDTFNHGWTSE